MKLLISAHPQTSRRFSTSQLSNSINKESELQLTFESLQTDPKDSGDDEKRPVRSAQLERKLS